MFFIRWEALALRVLLFRYGFDYHDMKEYTVIFFRRME
jgi:hypothetical protein